MDQVMDHLYISDMYIAQDYNLMIDNKITHVLIASKNIFPPYLGHFSYLVLPIEDHPSFNIIPMIEIANNFIEKAVQSGNVLVHCMAGMSRSASIVIGYLIYKGMTFSEAYKLMKIKHSITYPNAGFEDQLLNYAKAKK